MKLLEWTEKFLTIYKKPFLKPSTYERYFTCLKHVPPFLELEETTSEDLQLIINSMMTAGLSFSSIRQVKILLNQALTRAKRLGYRTTADFSLVDMPKNNPKLVRALSEDEQLTLIRNADKSFYGDFFLALLFTGCRVGELIALDWKDVDLHGGCFWITQTAYKRDTQSPKTAESLRKLPINDEFYAILSRNFARDGRVFRNTLGQSILYHTLLDCWHRFLDVCGLDLMGLHVLRHTYATNALRAGIDKYSLSSLDMLLLRLRLIYIAMSPTRTSGAR